MTKYLTFLLMLVSLLFFQQSAFAKKKAKSKPNYCLGSSYSAFKKRTTQYDKTIKKYSQKYGISTALIKSIITAESCFRSKAVSPKGAQGLMQLMPATAARFGVSDRFDTDLNIKAGTRYLKFLLGYFKGDFLNTIAAYNAGEGVVKKYKGIPPYKETIQYVSKVSTLYKFYSQGGGRKAYQHLSSGNFSKTFFVPRRMPKSRFSPYKNRQRNISHRYCKNSTSTRLRESTKVIGGSGIWQRIYTVKKGDTLKRVMQKTGVYHKKIGQMNGLRKRDRLTKGQQLLVWECRRK